MTRRPAPRTSPPEVQGSDRAVAIALAATALARVAATFLPSGWLWGLDTFRHLPRAESLVLALVTLAALAPPVARAVTARLERIGRAWQGAGLAADLAVALAVGVVIFAFRDPVRFTGDSLLRVGLIDISHSGAARLMRYYFPIDEAVNLGLPRLLVGNGLSPATALQAVGAMVGAAFAFVSIAMVRALGARGAAFASGALALLGSAVLVHFAGYDKFGPLMLGTALTVLGAVRLWRTGHGLVALAAGAAVTVLSHRSGYFLLPGVGWMLVRGLARARDAGSRVALVAAGAFVLIAAAIMLPRTIELATQVDLAVHLPGGRVAESRAAAGAPVGEARLANVANVLSFLVPLWPAGLVAAVLLTRRRGARDAHVPIAGAAVLALAGYGAVVAAIAPGGGWPRDWDDALAFAALVSLAGTACLVVAWSRLRGAASAGVAAVLALTTAAAMWTIHTDEATSVRRIDALLATTSMWSDFTRANACDVLGAREMNAGRFEAAAARYASAIESAPNPRYFHQEGLALLELGKPERAAAAFREAIARNPRVTDPWIGLAQAALMRADTTAALAAADSALVRNPGNSAARTLLARMRPGR